MRSYQPRAPKKERREMRKKKKGMRGKIPSKNCQKKKKGRRLLIFDLSSRKKKAPDPGAASRSRREGGMPINYDLGRKLIRLRRAGHRVGGPEAT